MRNELLLRANNACELCLNTKDLSEYTVLPKNSVNIDDQVLVCGVCKQQLDNNGELDPNHWHCLNESMWSTTPAVQVIAWRMLSELKTQDWANNLLDIMYLEDATLVWAKLGLTQEKEVIQEHKDSNGTVLNQGDTVTLLKDLDVKGAGFTAKRGTAVRNINLVENNLEHIEGKVNGQQIVILTKYVKKN